MHQDYKDQIMRDSVLGSKHWISIKDPFITVKIEDTTDTTVYYTYIDNPVEKNLQSSYKSFLNNFKPYVLENDSTSVGRKDDSNKPRYSLLPTATINQVVGVLEYGATKYEAGNWQRVPDSRNRYYDAAMRHIDAWWNGEKLDEESNLPHLAHAICCLLFLMWFDNKTQ